MKTLPRLYLIFATVLVGVLALSLSASAQGWWANPTYQPTPAETAQLPLTVTFDIIDGSGYGWLPVEGNTWEAIWPRNATGAWYRMQVYTQPALRQTKLWPWPYSCKATGKQFRCLDKTRRIYRDVTCPVAVVGPLLKWRSTYNGVWREQGLFWPIQGRIGAITGRSLPLTSTAVTAEGTTLHCKYGNPTEAGPGLHTDVWVYRY